MKVLCINNYRQFVGGTDKVAENEIQLLKENDQEIIRFDKSYAEITQYGLKEKLAFFPYVANHRRNLRQLEGFLRKERPDVAHIHNIYPLLSPEIYRLLKSLRIPSVQSLHDHRLPTLCPQGDAYRDGGPCDLCHGGNFLHSLKHRCMKGSLPISMAYAYALAKNRYLGLFKDNVTLAIYFNDYMKGKLESVGFPAGKMAHKAHFLTDDIGVPSYRRENYAVYMGAISPHKGILTLIRAFKEMGTLLRLKIVGDGTHFAEVGEYARANGMDNVEMLGYVAGSARYDVLRHASFSIVPSEFWETFCLTALESLACGVPVIGSNMGSIPYLVRDGETGLLFESGNAEDLRRKMVWLQDHPEEALAMGKKGRVAFEEGYTARANYSRLMEIYRQAIDIVKRNED